MPSRAATAGLDGDGARFAHRDWRDTRQARPERAIDPANPGAALQVVHLEPPACALVRGDA